MNVIGGSNKETEAVYFVTWDNVLDVNCHSPTRVTRICSIFVIDSVVFNTGHLVFFEVCFLYSNDTRFMVVYENWSCLYSIVALYCLSPVLLWIAVYCCVCFHCCGQFWRFTR
jgi:hypothetical protein